MSEIDSEQPPPQRSALATLDAWMAHSDWHPRILPFVVYIVFLLVVDLGRDYLPVSYPVLYVIQCGLVVWLLWRYRKLLPELNWKFHWLAVPTGVGLCAAWIALGYLMTHISPWFETAGAPGGEPHFFQEMQSSQPALYHLSIGLRLLGMALVVPMFEELFVRGFCLRALHNARRSAIGLLQVLHDMPLIGEWFMHTDWGRRAAGREGMFMEQFHATPLGKLSVFGVAASTFVFMVSHVPRDWPGCIACGVVWCWLLWQTNKRDFNDPSNLGLGPIVWSHGITNALLWGYTIISNDWQFL